MHNGGLDGRCWVVLGGMGGQCSGCFRLHALWFNLFHKTACDIIVKFKPFTCQPINILKPNLT